VEARRRVRRDYGIVIAHVPHGRDADAHRHANGANPTTFRGRVTSKGARNGQGQRCLILYVEFLISRGGCGPDAGRGRDALTRAYARIWRPQNL